MTGKQAYSYLRKSKPLYCQRLEFLILVFLLFTNNLINAQNQPEYDEIPVFVNVPGIGGGEVNAVIKDEEIYLPVAELFDFLRIKNILSPDLRQISGYFIKPEAEFLIDHESGTITFNKNKNILQPGSLLRTETSLCLKGDYFGKIFGLDCVFSFRNLSVTIRSAVELPVIREMKLAEMRSNLTKLKGEIKADSVIPRTYPIFHFGMADWSVIASEQINGQTDTRLNLGLGGMLAGGEANAWVNYDSRTPLKEKYQYYMWRYVNNDNIMLRQVRAGKITTGAISSLYNPVVGIQLTNTPSTYRRSFGTYTLSDKTEPDWIVELYVNNTLIDYVKADASGFFTFDVPLVYGNSNIKLRFYGPWGEERTKEQNIVIPFSFVPEKTLEYTASAGFVEDTAFSRFSRSSINYGLTNAITVGAGYEYLSSVTSGSFMPYVNGSFRVAKNFLVAGEYTNSVRAKGSLTYRLPSNFQLELNYIKYDKNQKAISYNYLEEKRIDLSIPLRTRNLFFLNRFSVHDIVMPAISYTTGEWLLSGSFHRLSANLTTTSTFIKDANPLAYSNLSLSWRFRNGLSLMPQTQYSYSSKELISARMAIEKSFLGKGFFNASYERNFRSNLNLGEIGFRYDFKFAQAGFTTRSAKQVITMLQYARGSLINDRKTKFIGADNRSNVGRAGISVLAFLDVNANGKRDPGEPKINGLNIRTPGRIEKNENDTVIRVFGLEPYIDYLVEIDQSGIENIAWKINTSSYKVSADPNKMKLIEIPVSVMAEASGTVSLQRERETTGIARIWINLYKNGNKNARRILSEDDGYFSFFGLLPGNYTVLVDTAQLKMLGLLSSPDSLTFTVNATREGEYIEGLDFTLKLRSDDTIRVREMPISKKDTAYLIVHEVTQELVTITEDSYAIQLGAFRNKPNAEILRRRLEKLLNRKVEIVIEDDFYKVRIIELKERAEVDSIIDILHKNGVNELWVISLKAKRQQLILVEKQDSIIQVTELPYLGSDFYKLSLPGRPVIEQTVLNEMEKLKPIDKVRYPDKWIMPVIIPADEPLPEPKREKIIINRAWTGNIKMPSFRKSGNVFATVASKIEAPVMKPQPTIALQVAVFQKESQAQQAKRKISSKLKVPVEIVKQWDSYHVIVTGFFTREETFRFYPELAGLGYNSVSIIDPYIRQDF